MKTGGCLCGAVRYEVEGEPAFSGVCHCSDCQKATGSGHAAVLAVPQSAVKISGETKGFDVVGGSKHTLSRNFCPVCGSLIFAKPGAMPGMILLTAGTLDDPSTYKPQVAIFTRSRPDWAKLGGGLPEFEGAPPAPPGGAAS
jgi:hypothetical protein